MAEPSKAKLTKVDFAHDVVGAVYDPKLGKNVGGEALVYAFATFEIGAPDRPNYHSVIRLRGTAPAAEGEDAAVRNAKGNFHRFMQALEAETREWGEKGPPFRH